MKKHPMKRSITFAAALCTLALLFTIACKKDQTILSSDIPADNAVVTSESSQVDAMSYPVAGPALHIPGFSSFHPSDLGPCAVITFDTASNARTITIDYGSGCTCWDGRTRSGQIVISWTGPYVQTGSSFGINSINYFVNNNKFAIHKTVVNSGDNAQSQPYFNVAESDTVTLDSTNQTITWTSNRVRTWTDGYSTPYVLADDVYSITGSGNGTDRDGDAYTCTITNPLMVKFGCPWIEAGTFQFNSAKFSQLTIDFGTGTCDNEATVTLNGNTYNIHMR
jgi:hypothetical protein